MMNRINGLLAFSFVGLSSSHALAYVGPGAGISAVGALLGLLAALALVLFGFVWYPVKRLRRRYRAKAVKPTEAAKSGGGDK